MPTECETRGLPPTTSASTAWAGASASPRQIVRRRGRAARDGRRKRPAPRCRYRGRCRPVLKNNPFPSPNSLTSGRPFAPRAPFRAPRPPKPSAPPARRPRRSPTQSALEVYTTLCNKGVLSWELARIQHEFFSIRRDGPGIGPNRSNRTPSVVRRRIGPRPGRQRGRGGCREERMTDREPTAAENAGRHRGVRRAHRPPGLAQPRGQTDRRWWSPCRTSPRFRSWSGCGRSSPAWSATNCACR